MRQAVLLVWFDIRDSFGDGRLTLIVHQVVSPACPALLTRLREIDPEMSVIEVFGVQSGDRFLCSASHFHNPLEPPHIDPVLRQKCAACDTMPHCWVSPRSLRVT